MNQDIVSENLAVVEAHFHSEAANEVEEAVKLYTEDIVWEAPNRNLVFVGKDAVADNYRKMFACSEPAWLFSGSGSLQRVVVPSRHRRCSTMQRAGSSTIAPNKSSNRAFS